MPSQWYAIYRKADGFIDRKQNNAPAAFMIGLDAATWGYLACDIGLDVDHNIVQAGAFVVTGLSQIELSIAVDAERDRRISLGVTWNGVVFQTRKGTDDLFNITSMGALASAKVNSGVVDSGYRWFDPTTDFYWIAADNSHVNMSAAEMIDFAATAATWVSRNTLVAAAIKATSGGIPSSYATDPRWPS